MRIYISGPITGRDRQKYLHHFIREEMKIKAEGHETLNPATMNMLMPHGSTHEDYMKVSIAELSICDAIYLLDDWKDSEGAWEEFTYAVLHNMPIFYESKKEEGNDVYKDFKARRSAKESL